MTTDSVDKRSLIELPDPPASDPQSTNKLHAAVQDIARAEAERLLAAQGRRRPR